MSFLYPLFLVAGLSLAIPVLIHLFNLRKYKTVLFPHTRFLKNHPAEFAQTVAGKIQMAVGHALLFLAFLIFAFAQPFFNKNNKKADVNKLQVIYLDNSYSMSVKKGARTVFDMAREAARKQVLHAAPGSRFLLLTNDKPASYRSEPADKVYAGINAADVSSSSKNVNQVMATVQSICRMRGAA